MSSPKRTIKGRIMNLIAKLLVLFFISTTISPGNTNEIYFTKTKTRLDLVEPSLGIWSGPRFGTSQCSFTCLQEPQCVSLLFNETTKLCYLFNVIFDGDESGDVESYWVINNGNTRFVPASCIDLLSCAVNTSDGEYWIYPIAANGRRTKIFCHDMATGPSHFITLKNANGFIEHDESNWEIIWQPCRSNLKPPLKEVEFTKIKIRIEDMVVNGTDYTFTSVTGSPTIKYGETADCNGEQFWNHCPHFGHAMIDTKGTGLIVDPTVVFGKVWGFETRATDFLRSADGSEISFSCAGWCGGCGPVSGPIKLVHSVEFISATDAQPIVCHK